MESNVKNRCYVALRWNISNISANFPASSSPDVANCTKLLSYPKGHAVNQISAKKIPWKGPVGRNKIRRLMLATGP